MRPSSKQIQPDIIKESSETLEPIEFTEVELLNVSTKSTVKSASGTGTVANCTALHVRNGGTHTHKILGYLKKGDKVNITGIWQGTDWYRIEFKGGVGYVNENYISGKVTVEPPKPPTPPSNNGLDTDLPYLIKEITTLEGDATVVPNFELKPRDIVTFNGLGSKLSGSYYIEAIKISISDDGISQVLTVTKNAFG